MLELPAGAQFVKIVCRGISGRKVPLRIGGQAKSGIELELSTHQVYRSQQFFKLYVDGRIIVSAKSVTRFLVERWPFLRAGLAAELQVRPVEQSGDWWPDGDDPMWPPPVV